MRRFAGGAQNGITQQWTLNEFLCSWVSFPESAHGKGGVRKKGKTAVLS
jgi:hypothetical protein